MKFMSIARKYGPRLGLGAGALLLAPFALASGDPYASLVSAVNFSNVTTDVVAVGALVVAVLVAVRAVRFIYGIVRR